MVENIPEHVAIVMDGNGRWAKQRHLPRVAGHQAGVSAVRSTVETCLQRGVKVLSLFAFSSENWQRPQQEVSFLMNLLLITLRKEVKQLHEHNIRLRIIGDKTPLNLKLQHAICDAEQLTVNNTALTLVVAINYGGAWDIVQATRHLLTRVTAGELSIQDIDEASLQQGLSTADLPVPDFFIRTSGEQRLSNFFLLQAAYAELYFTDVMWPDFSAAHFETALQDFSQRQRRYGRVDAEAAEVAHHA